MPHDRPSLSRAQQVAVEVENQLLADRTPVGTSLGRRTDLLNRFGVSPTVINEALRILRDRGLVIVRPGPGGGVFVASRPPQVRLGALDLWFSGGSVDPLDLFEARSHLEDVLTSVAIDRAGPTDVRDMEWALESMRTSLDDPTAFGEADVRFHDIVMEISGNRLAESIARSLFERARDSARYHGMTPPSFHERTLREHEAVFATIETRTTEAAEHAMYSHIIDAWQRRRLPDHSGTKPRRM